MPSLFSKIKNRYMGISVEVKATFWYTVCNTLLKAISLITVPIFTRVLSEADYGTVGVYNGWHDIIFILGTLNLYYSAYNTAIIKYKDDIDRFTSSMIGLINVISCSMVIIYFFAKDFFDNLFGMSPSLLVIALAELLTVPAYNFWMARERFKYNYKNVVIVTLTVSIAAPLLSLLFVLTISNNKAFYKILGTAIPCIFVGAILTILYLRKGKKLFSKEYWLYGLKFNIPLIPHYLSGTVLNQSDRIMISNMISVDKAGIYSVAYNASFTISILTTAINQSLVPWMYNNMRERNCIAIRKRATQILIVLASILVLFILVVPEVVSILAPPSYREAIGILPVLVMSVYFQFLYGLFGTIDFYFEKSVYPMLASVIAALTNLLTNFWLIPSFGYLAAGYTTLFSFIVMTIMHYIFMKFVLKKNRIEEAIFDIRKIVLISMVFIVTGLGESMVYGVPVIRYALAILIFIVMYIKRQTIIGIIKK